MSESQIAKDMGVHRSTINRELKRNSGQRGYRYNQAQQKAQLRREQLKVPYKFTSQLQKAIEEKLTQEQWSPQQIAGRFKTQSIACISHERIYQHIWQDKRNGGTLYKHLRHAGKKYNKRSGKHAGRGCIPGRVDIEQRPAIIEQKTRLGDWELDTLIGANHRGAVLSLVERASKYTQLRKLPTRQSQHVEHALIQTVPTLQGHCHSFTMDNGKEFAGHLNITRLTGVACYFAKPYHSWQRGLNEHTNGLVRQYLPKHTDFTTLTQDQLLQIQNKLNNRPRAVLNFLTPSEVFMANSSPPSVALHC